jgi:hypothetical protein
MQLESLRTVKPKMAGHVARISGRRNATELAWKFLETVSWKIGR